MIVSRISGEPLGEVFRQRISRPLGLKATAYNPQGPIRGLHPRGYSLESDGRLVDMTDVHPGKAADGGIVSNAPETAKFLSSLMGGKLLPQPVVRSMQTNAFWNGGVLTPCGSTVYGHSGAGSAFRVDVVANSDGSRVAVLMLNGRGNGITDAKAGAAVTRLFCAAQR